MKERFLDIIKWGLIIAIAGAVYYFVCPKYYFYFYKSLKIRGNRITGHVEQYSDYRWIRLIENKDIVWDKPKEDIFDRIEKECQSIN